MRQYYIIVGISFVLACIVLGLLLSRYSAGLQVGGPALVWKVQSGETILLSMHEHQPPSVDSTIKKIQVFDNGKKVKQYEFATGTNGYRYPELLYDSQNSRVLIRDQRTGFSGIIFSLVLEDVEYNPSGMTSGNWVQIPPDLP